MSGRSPVLHLFCGMMASGKSTLAASLASADGTVLIAEDQWLSTLFGPEMSTAQDYLRFASRLRSRMAPHVVSLLDAGVSVVLDFPANTAETRAWMRGILDQTGAAHQLHVLAVPDDLCLARLRQRNADGSHPFAPTEAQFRRFSAHYSEPTAEEGFDILRHVPEG